MEVEFHGGVGGWGWWVGLVVVWGDGGVVVCRNCVELLLVLLGEVAYKISAP